MKKRVALITGVIVLVGAALIGAGRVLWVRRFHHYSPWEVLKDVRAGLAARSVPQPRARVEAFLATRYGPLTDPANRQHAFLDFFNVDHLQGLDFITGHTPPAQQQADTQAMAEWIAHYRETMSREERAALLACVNSESGRAMLARSTAHYLAQDEAARNAQKSVMMELTATLAALWKP